MAARRDDRFRAPAVIRSHASRGGYWYGMMNTTDQDQEYLFLDNWTDIPSPPYSPRSPDPSIRSPFYRPARWPMPPMSPDFEYVSVDVPYVNANVNVPHDDQYIWAAIPSPTYSSRSPDPSIRDRSRSPIYRPARWPLPPVRPEYEYAPVTSCASVDMPYVNANVPHDDQYIPNSGGMERSPSPASPEEQTSPRTPEYIPSVGPEDLLTPRSVLDWPRFDLSRPATRDWSPVGGWGSDSP